MIKEPETTVDLFRAAAVQFRFYAQQHLEKTKTAASKPLEIAARQKSAVNLSLAERIEDHLRLLHHQTHPLSPWPEPVKPEDLHG